MYKQIDVEQLGTNNRYDGSAAAKQLSTFRLPPISFSTQSSGKKQKMASERCFCNAAARLETKWWVCTSFFSGLDSLDNRTKSMNEHGFSWILLNQSTSQQIKWSATGGLCSVFKVLANSEPLYVNVCELSAGHVRSQQLWVLLYSAQWKKKQKIHTYIYII